MRLLDSDKSLAEVFVYLTKLEAKELIDSLENLLASPVGNHSHIPRSLRKRSASWVVDRLRLWI
jgi:hypothetical protein